MHSEATVPRKDFGIGSWKIQSNSKQTISVPQKVITEKTSNSEQLEAAPVDNSSNIGSTTTQDEIKETYSSTSIVFPSENVESTAKVTPTSLARLSTSQLSSSAASAVKSTTSAIATLISRLFYFTSK